MYYAMYNVKTPQQFLQVGFRVLSCNVTLFHLSSLHENIFSITLLLFTEAVVLRCFCKKDVLRNITKFTGPRPVFLLKKKHWHRCFSVNLRMFPWIRLKKLQNMQLLRYYYFYLFLLIGKVENHQILPLFAMIKLFCKLIFEKL